MNAPCKNCPDREIGCHSKCNKYSEFRKKRDEELDRKRKEDFELHQTDCSRAARSDRLWLPPGQIPAETASPDSFPERR